MYNIGDVLLKLLMYWVVGTLQNAARVKGKVRTLGTLTKWNTLR